MGTSQNFRRYFRVGFERLGQLIQVDLIVVNAVQWRKSLTTHEGQASVEWQIATLTIYLAAFAGTGALPFRTTASRLPLTGRDTAPDAFSILLAARVGHE